MSDKRVKRFAGGESRFSKITSAINEDNVPQNEVGGEQNIPVSEVEKEIKEEDRPSEAPAPAAEILEKPVEKLKVEPISETIATTNGRENSTPPEKKVINKFDKFDVLKADLCKEDDEISGQLTNLGIYKEMYFVLGKIADDAGISLKSFANNVIYDWLINNPEAIQRAKKMAKERGGLSKRFL